MAGTLPILKIRSSNFLVGLLTAIPMTCYNERKIFKILKFLTHPTTHITLCTLHCALRTMHIALCTLHYAHFSMHIAL